VLASDDEKRAGADWRKILCAKAHPKMFNAWLTLGPQAHRLRPKFVQSLWKAKEIYITERPEISNKPLSSRPR